MTKKILKWSLGGLVMATILFGSGFYYKWFYTDKDIPIFSEFNGESLASQNYLGIEDEFRKALLKTQNETKMPAVSAAVYVDGEYAWAGAQGLADIETGATVKLSHKFRLGSTSKTFISSLALLMAEKGLVDLDEPISTYIDTLPENYRQLSLRKLLSHTSGVRNYKLNFGFFPPHEGVISRQYASATQALEIFINDPLVFPPGEGFQYSSWGFVLASAVLEAAGGKDLPALLEEQLLSPIQLTNIVAEFSGRDEADKVGLYLTEGGQYTLAYPINTSVKWAAGGLLATPTDVAGFSAKLLAGEILSDQSLDNIWTPVALSDGSMNEQNYGLGFRIDTSVRLLGEDRPTKMLHHGGRVAGGSSFLMIIPEFGVVASVQANTDELAARQGVQDLAYELIRIAIRNKENGSK